jgi:nucleoside-diphosphate-sugar epimerase
MPRRQTVAITGAAGFVGSTLVDYFSQQGWNVIGLVRNASERSRAETRPSVSFREYDITKQLKNGSLNDVDYLVHAAYIKFSSKNTAAFEQNVEGAKRIVLAARRAGIKRSIFISTMSAHDEAISIYGRQKLEAESYFDSEHETIIKPGLIIGNGGIVKDMSAFMKSKHAVPLIGGGRQPLQIIAIDDLVRIIENIFTKDLAGTFVAATPITYTYKQFYAALAAHLKVKVLYVPLPYWALQSLFRVAALLHIPLGLGEDNLKGLKMLRSMDSQADMNAVGVKPLSLGKALAKTK